MVLAGAAGCGKSSFAGEHFASVEVLSSDDFRELVSGDPAEQAATPATFSLLMDALGERLKRRRLTVVDATNVARRDRRRLLGMAERHAVPAVAVVFDLPLAVCRQRASDRPGRRDPDDVVERQRTLGRHLGELADEGFEDVAILTSADEVTTAAVVRVPAGRRETDRTPAPALPPAAIVDLDGTLASATWREHHPDRRPRDRGGFFAGMRRDAPVPGLVDLTTWIAHHAAVVLPTGRPDDHDPLVRRWLADHRVPYDLLLMRASGDRRPDPAMKRERYHRVIEPRYDIRVVIDDRPGVIAMWREEGLYVLTAVDPGLDPFPER